MPERPSRRAKTNALGKISEITGAAVRAKVALVEAPKATPTKAKPKAAPAPKTTPKATAKASARFAPATPPITPKRVSIAQRAMLGISDELEEDLERDAKEARRQIFPLPEPPATTSKGKGKATESAHLTPKKKKIPKNLQPFPEGGGGQDGTRQAPGGPVTPKRGRPDAPATPQRGTGSGGGRGGSSATPGAPKRVRQLAGSQQGSGSPRVRVAGKAASALQNRTRYLYLHEVQADLFSGVTQNNTVIIHACNGEGSWGSGVAAELARRYPNAYQSYRNWCRQPGRTAASLVGTSFLIDPQPGDPPGVWIGCLFTSRRGGRSHDIKDQILHHTVSAMHGLMAELYNYSAIPWPDDIDFEGGLRMPQINAGVFRVPWIETHAQLHGMQLRDNNPREGLGNLDTIVSVYKPPAAVAGPSSSSSSVVGKKRRAAADDDEDGDDLGGLAKRLKRIFG